MARVESALIFLAASAVKPAVAISVVRANAAAGLVGPAEEDAV